MRDKWEKLISEFRILGGTANNVCQKDENMAEVFFLLTLNFNLEFYPYKINDKKILF